MPHCDHHHHCCYAQELLAFLLSPEARDLRPLLLTELVSGLDLLLRDRLRRAADGAASALTPRLPFLGSLSSLLPPPVVPVPGRGLLPASQLVEELAPPLTQPEEIYLQSFVELAAGLLGVRPAELETPGPALLQQLLLSPSEQARELQQALSSLAGGGSSGTGGGDPAVVREMTAQVVDGLLARAAGRMGVAVDTLFPMRGSLLAAIQ